MPHHANQTETELNLSGRNSLISHPLNEAEMTQIAFRIVRAYGGHINFFRLMKLFYIVEHESWKHLSQPAMGGEYFSLEDGPMISEAANATKPEHADDFKIWSEFFETIPYKIGNKIKGSEIKIRDGKMAGIDEIPSALLKIIDAVISQTRCLKNEQLKAIVHDVKRFKEYKQPPTGRRFPIKAEEILEGVGKSPEKIKKIQAESEEWKKFEAALA